MELELWSCGVKANIALSRSLLNVNSELVHRQAPCLIQVSAYRYAGGVNVNVSLRLEALP